MTFEILTMDASETQEQRQAMRRYVDCIAILLDALNERGISPGLFDAIVHAWSKAYFPTQTFPREFVRAYEGQVEAMREMAGLNDEDD